ncbi:probable disease resistance protein RPP1 [Brassica napus]|uniref:probable disease resistance protein RPP1 n=1 Tax=Brassica napus TaxID=3708 RepID=UPI00207872DD|nr:probable disease resistance protein RPP1 [Brassica napus]
MHSLLEQLGKEITHKEYRDEYGRCKFVVDAGELGDSIEGRTYKGIVDPFKGLSPFPSRCSHQVFPSFCGVDVRKAFLPHMLKEFKNKGITVFTDNKDIKRSMSIGPELKEAIKGSRVSIVIVSKNYASSTWCLDELVLIIKCREELGQIVMPIFYEVEPTDVKRQKEYFGSVFEKTCEGKSVEDIEKWKQALKEVATIAGFDSGDWLVIFICSNHFGTSLYMCSNFS